MLSKFRTSEASILTLSRGFFWIAKRTEFLSYSSSPVSRAYCADDDDMNSELMRQLVALNDKIVNGEELNALQRQLRSELSALLAQETAEKNKPKSSPVSTESENDFSNDPVYVSPWQSNSVRNDTNESLNDPVDCNPSFNVSTPFDAGSRQTSNVFQSVRGREAIIREQEATVREQEKQQQAIRAQEAKDQELARQRERARQEQAQRAWAQQEAERQQRKNLTTEGDHTVRKCSSCGHSQILVEGMYRDNRDTMEVHTCQRCNDKLHYNHTSFDRCTINRNGTDGHRFVSGIRVDYSKMYNVPV